MKKILSLLLVCALVLTFSGCSKDCEDLELSKDSITFTREGQTKGLNVTTDPKDTTDEVEFESDDEDVATVNEDGLIRAEGPGETTITVRCGDEVAYCEVICDFGGNSGNEHNDDPDTPHEPTPNPDDPDPTEEPEPTEEACDTCGGTKVCPECDGNYKCQECGGSGDCQRCDGEGEVVCPACDGDLFECKECDGDGVTGMGQGIYCYTCSGTGRVCETCRYGDGAISCPAGCDNGYCPECDGERVVCLYCNKGVCPDCG